MHGGTKTRWAAALALAIGSLAAGSGVAGATPTAPGSSGAAAQADDPTGEFTSMTPRRILDTRSGLGTPDGKYRLLDTQETMSVQVTGRGGVPAEGVSAVVMNVTVPTPAGVGYLTVWPSGRPRPEVSNVNWSNINLTDPSQPITPSLANLVTVAVGDGGKVDVFNQLGSTSVVFDVVGYYSDGSGPQGSRYRSLSPDRLFDTRSGLGSVDDRPVGSREVLKVDVTGHAGVPETGVTGVVMNVTITDPVMPPRHESYLTVYPDGATRPAASNLNWQTGMTVANAVTVGVPANGIVDIFNLDGTAEVFADVVGYYTTDDTGDGGRFVSLDPTRVTDTRRGLGSMPGPIWPWVSHAQVIAGSGGIPAEGAAAAVMNVTVTEPTAPGWITVHPDDECGVVPEVSSLNFRAGQTIPNLVIGRLATEEACHLVPGASYFRNGSPGLVHLLVDVFGYFTAE